MQAGLAEIRTGDLGAQGYIRDYRAERLGEVLIERVIWDDGAFRERYGLRVAGPGYIWFRFWLQRVAQVIERYYLPDAELIGTAVRVSGPIVCDSGGCHALDLILSLWIAPDGRVTLHDELPYEDAVRTGRLSEEESSYAERHLRELTTGIAQARFPPPIVRNWQIDRQRIQEPSRSPSDPS